MAKRRYDTPLRKHPLEDYMKDPFFIPGHNYIPGLEPDTLMNAPVLFC